MRLLFFGPLSDFSDTRELERPDNIDSVQSLQDWLGQENPALGEALGQKSLCIAVNGEIVGNTHPLGDTDEIAFMSPMSGG